MVIGTLVAGPALGRAARGGGAEARDQVARPEDGLGALVGDVRAESEQLADVDAAVGIDVHRREYLGQELAAVEGHGVRGHTDELE